MTNYIEQFMKDNNLQLNERFKIDDCTLYFDDVFSLRYVEGYEANGGTLWALLSGESKIKKLKKDPWKPKEGENFWYVDSYGCVGTANYGGYKYEDYLINHRLLFESEEEAEDYKWFLDKVDEYKKPFEKGAENHFFTYDKEVKEVQIIKCFFLEHQGVVWFGSIENIQEFKDEVGEDRIKKYMFGVYE